MLTRTVRFFPAYGTADCASRLPANAVLWLIIGLGFSAPSVAQDSGFYIGGAVGSAEHVKGAALKLRDAPLMTGEADSRVLSWNVTLGYQVNPNIGFELGYLDLGEVDASVADPTGATDAEARFTLATRGPTLSMVGTFPFGKWTPYIRAGVLFSETELKYSGRVQGAVFSNRVSGDSEAAFFGAGVTFDLGSRLALQADFTHVMNAAAPEFGQSDCHNLSLGLKWKF
jgi:outer membrane autotransporter protein